MRKKQYVYYSGDMMKLKTQFQELFAKYHDFQMKLIYGENLDTIRTIVIKMKHQPEFLIKSVCDPANDLNQIAKFIQKKFPKFVYKGETEKAFAEKFRHCVLSNRY